MKRKALAVFVGIIGIFLVSSVGYGQTHFTATLNKAQVVSPPSIENEPTGTGSFTLTGDETSGFALDFQITVTNLSGPIIGARFHRAQAGKAGGRVSGFNMLFNGNTATGVWNSSSMRPLTPELAKALLVGEIYAEIQTEAGGEVRGQIYPTLNFEARFDTAQEVPAPAVSTTPTGTGSFTLHGTRTGGVELAFDITADALSGPIVAAHFHRGAPGVAGPVVRTITSEFNRNTASGVWSSTDDDPLTPDLLKALVNGEIYVNIHTAANPAGEIRGQVILKPTPPAV